MYCRKRLADSDLNDCNDRIGRNELKRIRSSDAQGPGDDSGKGKWSYQYWRPAKPVGSEPSDQNQPKQSSLLIDATYAAVDIPQPTDRSLLNVDEIFSEVYSEGVARKVGLDPTNHPRRRALRPAVIQRKSSHAVLCIKGAICRRHLLSVTATFRQHRNIFFIPWQRCPPLFGHDERKRIVATLARFLFVPAGTCCPPCSSPPRSLGGDRKG